MSLNITYETCIKFYEYFYSKISGQQNYIYKLRKQERSCVESFLKQVDGWGDESLFNYLLFAFSKYEGLDTNQGRNNIKIMWVFGTKTFNEYKNRDVERNSYYSNLMGKTYRIKKEDLIEQESVKLSFGLLNQKERRRFQDKDRQFLHCIENELYDEKSSDCIICSKRKECLKLK